MASPADGTKDLVPTRLSRALEPKMQTRIGRGEEGGGWGEQRHRAGVGGDRRVGGKEGHKEIWGMGNREMGKTEKEMQLRWVG